MKPLLYWRIDSWNWKEKKLLMILRGFDDGEFMTPEGNLIQSGHYRNGWPDARAARYWPDMGAVLCEGGAEAAIERALEIGGFRRTLPVTQTPWKVSHWRIVDALERFRGVDAFVLNARQTLARRGELSPKMTDALEKIICRLRGPWAE